MKLQERNSSTEQCPRLLFIAKKPIIATVFLPKLEWYYIMWLYSSWNFEVNFLFCEDIFNYFYNVTISISHSQQKGKLILLLFFFHGPELHSVLFGAEKVPSAEKCLNSILIWSIFKVITIELCNARLVSKYTINKSCLNKR